jgi:hypothetical protein
MTVQANVLRDKRPQFLRVFDTEYKHFATIPKGTRAFAMAVYMCLASHASSKSDVVFPSHAVICEHTGLSKPTVIKAIDALIESGHVMVESRPNKVNRYTLLSVVVNDVDHQDVVVNDVDPMGSDVDPMVNGATHLVSHVYTNQINYPDQVNQIKEPEREAPCRFATSPKRGTPSPSINLTSPEQWQDIRDDLRAAIRKGRA